MTQPIVEEKSLVNSTYKKETNLSNHLRKHYVKMQYNISIHIHRYKNSRKRRRKGGSKGRREGINALLVHIGINGRQSTSAISVGVKKGVWKLTSKVWGPHDGEKTDTGGQRGKTTITKSRIGQRERKRRIRARRRKSEKRREKAER